MQKTAAQEALASWQEKMADYRNWDPNPDVPVGGKIPGSESRDPVTGSFYHKKKEPLGDTRRVRTNPEIPDNPYAPQPKVQGSRFQDVLANMK